GSTGCGKSFLSSALGHQACLQGYKVAYFNTQKLMLKAKLVRLEGSSIRFFDKLAKADLLILDDFGLTHLDKQQEMDFMEMIEDRHGKCSTIIVSQLPVASWYDVFTEETIADYHNFFIMRILCEVIYRYHLLDNYLCLDLPQDSSHNLYSFGEFF